MYITIDTITMVVAKVTGLPEKSILSKARTKELCYARAYIVIIGRKYGHTFIALGNALNRHYSTCVKNYQVIDNELFLNPAIKHQLNECYTEIKHLESLTINNYTALQMEVLTK